MTLSRITTVVVSVGPGVQTGAVCILGQFKLGFRGFGLVLKHMTADPGIASSIPPHSK